MAAIDTLEDSRVPLLVGFAITLIVLSTLAVCVRFWSRTIVPGVWIWWDDWAIFVTLIFSNLNCGFIIWATKYGLGHHKQTVPRSDATMSSTISLVTEIWYATATFMLRISALILYARIFRISNSFRTVLWITGTAIIVWWILVIVLPFTHCSPPLKAFFPLIKGHCSGGGTPWYLGSSITNVLLDLIVLILPIPMILMLQLKLEKKIQILLTFILGYSSAFVGLARFSIVASDPAILSDETDKDLTYRLVPLLLLSMLEPPLGILALCGPSVRQQVILGTSHGFKALFMTGDSHHRLVDTSSCPTSTGAIDRQTNGRSGNKSTTGFSKIFGASNKRETLRSSAMGTSQCDGDDVQSGMEMPMDRMQLTGENKV